MYLDFLKLLYRYLYLRSGSNPLVFSINDQRTTTNLVNDDVIKEIFLDVLLFPVIGRLLVQPVIQLNIPWPIGWQEVVALNVARYVIHRYVLAAEDLLLEAGILGAQVNAEHAHQRRIKAIELDGEVPCRIGGRPYDRRFFGLAVKGDLHVRIQLRNVDDCVRLGRV